MVRIDKSSVSVPAILVASGLVETTSIITAYNNGLQDFDFRSAIYGHKSVKTILKKIQSKKCCFCESKVPHIAHGDVEHFRPKGGVQKEGSISLTKPGYYWLAYNFSNLFFSCQICNQKYKQNFFPLKDESKRAESHLEDYRLEENLILHPEFDNPEDHLTFERDVIKPKNNSIKGEATIKYTGLDRDDLEEQRREYLAVFELLAILARDGNTEAKKYFKKIGKPSAIFSLMIKCNFPDLI